MAEVKKETKKKRTYGLIEPTKYEKVVAYAEEHGTTYNAIICELVDEFIRRKGL